MELENKTNCIRVVVHGGEEFHFLPIIKRTIHEIIGIDRNGGVKFIVPMKEVRWLSECDMHD